MGELDKKFCRKMTRKTKKKNYSLALFARIKTEESKTSNRFSSTLGRVFENF